MAGPLWVALGSALGGMARYGVSGVVANRVGETFPWGTLVVNVSGCFVVGVFAAYVAGRALPSGTDYLRVFQFVGATAFLGYSFALWPIAIWYHRSLGTTIRSTIDGLLYALLTAGTFGWLWPR